jgi:citrate synthase
VSALGKDQIMKILSGTSQRQTSLITYTTQVAIDVDLFTPVFAVSRINGWTTHRSSNSTNNRLIHPRADYTGPTYPQHWVPIE